MTKKNIKKPVVKSKRKPRSLSVETGSALWQPAATAPKTRVILADTGYPWPLPCLWDAEAGKWAVAFLNVENQNAAKESQNVWWETEYECAITAWAEVPALPNDEAHRRLSQSHDEK